MASFKFGSGKKSYTIEGMSKEYFIDVGNVETMKTWRAGVVGISEEVEKLKTSGDNIDALVSICRDLVNLVLDGDFEPLWDLCEHNIYAMLGLISDLAKKIKDAQNSIETDYGL